MKRTQQNIWIDKTMARPVGIFNNQEKSIICNKALQELSMNVAVYNVCLSSLTSLHSNILHHVWLIIHHLTACKTALFSQGVKRWTGQARWRYNNVPHGAITRTVGLRCVPLEIIHTLCNNVYSFCMALYSYPRCVFMLRESVAWLHNRNWFVVTSSTLCRSEVMWKRPTESSFTTDKGIKRY